MGVAVRINDRTNEFQHILRDVKRRQAFKPGSQRLLNDSQKAGADGSRAMRKSEFARNAASIGRGIAATMGHLEKLSQLARKKTFFLDQPVEINELTFMIRKSLRSLNDDISNLQRLTAANHAKDQEGEHNKNVCWILQSKLTNVSANFKDVLEARTKNLQASKSRTDNFVSSVSQQARLTSLAQQSASPLYGLTPRSSPSPAAADQLSLNPVGESQLLMMEEGSQAVNNSYIQQRGETIDQINSTINELGGIFAQLAQMVTEQSEKLQRIDQDTDDIVESVEGAQKELLKYFSRVSSNRWLIAKMFGVLMIFFLLWVLVAG